MVKVITYFNYFIVGEKVNKESVENAKTNVGSYLNSMYNGLKTSVETIQKEGIPVSILYIIHDKNRSYNLITA